MRQETYQLRAKGLATTFEFISEGPKGAIKKRVQYQKIIEDEDFYNLAFGDINAVTDEIDDKVISDNSDMKKVLATVATTVSEFMKEHPNALIYIEGSNPARTRLYRIGISNNFEYINEDFTVLGLFGKDDWRIFERNNNYSAFLITKK